MESNNQISNINRKRIKDRSITEFIGLCKGIISSGDVSTSNAEFILSWLNANPLVSENWLGRDIYKKLHSFLADNKIDGDEEKQLLSLLMEITGRPDINLAGYNASTTLPLCKNPPNPITIDGHNFVLTGNFEYGKRKNVNTYILDRGGVTKKDPSSKTDYLIIGAVGSEAWIQSGYGRKIDKGVELRDEGQAIRIIDEAHFFKSTESAELITPSEETTNEEALQQLVKVLQENEQKIESLENSGLLFHLEPIYLAAYQTFKNGKAKKSPYCELFYNDEHEAALWIVQEREKAHTFNSVNNAFEKFVESIN